MRICVGIDCVGLQLSSNVIWLDVEASDTIENVRLMIAEKTGRSPCCQGLLFFGVRILECDRQVCDYNIQRGCTLLLSIARPVHYTSAHKELVVSHMPASMQENVELQPQIFVEFGMSPSLCRCSFERCPYRSKSVNLNWYIAGCALEEFHNSWSHDGGGDCPANLIFTQEVVRERFVVLKLRTDEFPDSLDGQGVLDKLEHMRYNYNNWNYGGDMYAWQYYTRELPCAAKLIADDESQRITAILHSPLEPSAWHVLALLHGNFRSQPTKGGGCIYDDFLIPFKTRAVPVLQLHGQQVDSKTIEVCVINLAGEEVMKRSMSFTTTLKEVRELCAIQPLYQRAEFVCFGTADIFREDSITIAHLITNAGARKQSQ